MSRDRGGDYAAAANRSRKLPHSEEILAVLLFDSISGSWLGTGGEVENSSQAACFITRLKGEVRVCSGASPRSQLIN